MTSALSLAWVLVLAPAVSLAGDHPVARRVEREVLEPSLRAVGDAPGADSAVGRAAAGISRQWVSPAADQAGLGMMSAARTLGDPNAAEMPSLWLPDKPANPLAARTVDLISASFVDPLAKHAHDAAMTASRRLGSLENYAMDVLLPDLNWNLPDFLAPTLQDGKNGSSAASPDPKVLGRFPSKPKETRKDSLDMIQAPRGARPAHKEKLKPVEPPSFGPPTR